jgi:hypothetical protein
MSRQDKDYRGQKRPADFSRFVYEVRRGKPGALEVLQDVIEETFPKQFQAAKEEATDDSDRVRRNSRVTGPTREDEYVVLFDGRIARQRFMPWQDPRSALERTPLRVIHAQAVVRAGYLPAYNAIVWSTRTGSKISNKLRQLTRRRRHPFFDVKHPTGPRWYGRVR